MKKAVILMVLLFLVRLSYGQTEWWQDTLPLVVETKWEEPSPGNSLRYFFPKVIDSLMNEVIVKNSYISYSMMYTHGVNDTNIISLYGARAPIDSLSSNVIDLLLLTTNRSYKIGGLVIPIYFPSDIACSLPTKFAYTGSLLYVKFVGTYPSKGRVIFCEMPQLAHADH